MYRWCLVMLVSLAAVHPVKAQEVLTLDNVLDIVRRYHPVARQANLSVDSAEAFRMAVRGAFDPAVYVRNEQKTFDGKSYYYYTNPEIKIPTWYGLELKAGLENNGGERLDPEVTPGRSSYAGLSMPLMKNLLFDRRRASLSQARLLIQQTEADRLNAYNDLLFNAAETYWDWVREYQVFRVLTQAITINRQRLNLVRQSFLGGERAAIDTLEALAQLQSFEFLQSDALLRFRNAAFELSNYLWLENEQPYELPANVIPDTTWSVVRLETYPLPVLEQSLATALATHPKLRSLGFKVDALEVERRLKFQSLLPTFDVHYNFLNKGYQPVKGIGSNMFENNYKYGFVFGLPLLQRQARGEYRIAGIKIEQTSLQVSQVRLEIENKVKSYYNQILQMRQQVRIFEENLQLYMRLLRAEEVRFSIGESSLFLINARENKVLETQQKLQELRAKFFKSLVALQWAMGQL
ncbi:TolC family protein [Aridibaculum aurantiacum]|uniref:TolC family protein n=1 Tax=Aridibaculum aurantiacum TaxID=2810307 RepID=UPI001A95E4C3|nr:TolC family protein [Aridibaculum aurantiacum]